MKEITSVLVAVCLFALGDIKKTIVTQQEMSIQCMELGIRQAKIDGINKFFHQCLANSGEKDFSKEQQSIVEQCWELAEKVYVENNKKKGAVP